MPSPAPRAPEMRHLGDFDVTPRLFLITAIALPIGALVAGVAWCLLRLIGLITNLVFYQRWGTALVAPGAEHHSPLLILLAPVAGGLVVGLFARFGSEKIRGHGIPEAMDSVLTGGSKVQPRVALLKPIASAIAIGTGGPFGAEGPIIMTGGAFGSIGAQLLNLSADERKTLLCAGAAAGMAAVFDTPLAAVLLAIELLLFEWRPRSFVPVAAAVAVATVLRVPILGSGPVFPAPTGSLHLEAGAYLLCVVAGGAAAALALVSSTLVYFSEDSFGRLPIHWMWWPAIGGVIIGVGGLIVPQALGVGYNVIGEQLDGTATLHLMIGILIVKTLIWSLSLGSGTSGGVLAPLLMIGSALGGLEAQIFPAVGPGFWPLVGLAAILAAAMRAPLTGVVFAVELTHRYEALLPLLIGAAAAYAISVLFLRRSILTEKIARRGVHVNHEYSVDPLEVLFVGDVMSDPDQAAAANPAAAITNGNRDSTEAGDGASRLVAAGAPVVFADDTLRHVANAMADSGRTELPVAERTKPAEPVGTVRLEQLLEGRLRDLDEERRRDRPLRPLSLLGVGRAAAKDEA
jgi:chloride channel protein, CIC family